jgi:predicted PurR-regulated permease PerM
MSDNGSPAVFTRERVLTSVLALLTLITLYVCYRIIEPFVPAIAFALALAVATQAPFQWLRSRIRNAPVAAAIAVVLVALLIIGPAAFLTTYIVQTAAENISELQGGRGIDLQHRLEELPLIGGLVREVTGRFRIEEQIGTIGQAVASRATGVLSTSFGFLTQLGVTLFVLFFLYRDCGQAVNALRQLLPLSNREADQLFQRVASTISATVNGSLTVALIQAVLAGTVYLLLGVPGAVLWGAATFLMALVPVLGTFLVWAPIALWLGLTGHIGKALFLAVWGGAVVGSIDNILYPYLVGGKLRLHTVPTFFSVIGGIALFGPAGIILGPMVVAITIALVDVWFHRTEHGQAAEEAISDKAEAEERPGEVLQDHTR